MKTSFPAYWRGMASGTSRGAGSRLLRGLLVPASVVYAVVQRLRAGLYRCGVLRARKLDRPVISIGNITQQQHVNSIIFGVSKFVFQAINIKLLCSNSY